MIGTLTVHYNSNYGANLQAYALRLFISQKALEDVCVIDYRNDMIRNLYAVRPWDLHFDSPHVTINVSSIKRFLKICTNLDGTVVRFLKFRKFRAKYIQTTRKVWTINGISSLNCSIIVIGSDQIWNDSITNDKEKAFWGAMKNERNIVVSYAPSFGRSTITPKELENVKKCLNNFDYITVREPSMVDILSPYTNREIHIVCDPVFLLTKKEWSNLIHPTEKNYILVYLVERNPMLLDIANFVSKILNKKIIVLSSGKKLPQKIGKYYKTADPSDFVSYFYNSDFVVTNSFHGTAFALLFNKKFLTLPDTKKPARMIELLDLCGLSDRICYKVDDIGKEKVLEQISFENANAVIEKMRSESETCIEDILNVEKENNGG